MSEYTVEASYYVSDDSYVVEVYDEVERKELEDNHTEIESFSVIIPDETIDLIIEQETEIKRDIYYQGSSSDGYISIYFYEDQSLLEFHASLSNDQFACTDSEGGFSCSGFDRTELTTLDDILEDVYTSSQVIFALSWLEEHRPDQLQKWQDNWRECELYDND